MRILLVTGKLTYSNGTTYALDLARALGARGHELLVASQGGVFFSELKSLATDSYVLDTNYFSYRRLVQIFREFRPQIAHSTGFGALASAAKLARKLAVPLLHTVHSWLPAESRATLPEEAVGFVVPNQDLRELLVNDVGIEKGLVHVIPYGVDGELHRPPAAPGAPGAASGVRPVVGMIGRLDEGRQYEVFLEAAQIIHRQAPEVLFLIAGEGPAEKRLRRRVHELGLDPVVTFAEPQARSCEIYALLDVLVVISDRGGVGLNLLEGMAHERAIVATGSGEVFSILNDENVGVVIPQRNPAALAEALLELVRDPVRRVELGHSARAHALEFYPAEQQTARLEHLYSMFDMSLAS